MKFKNHYEQETIFGFDSNCLISEGGLSRVLDHAKNNTFSIITAFRGEYDNKENLARNKELRGVLNSKKMGSHILIGHWKECQVPDTDYKDCPEDKMVDVVEQSFLVPKPKDMSDEEFGEFIQGLVAEYDQDGAILKKDDGIYIVEPTSEFKIGSDVVLNKIGQAYSQYVKKKNVPFVFEGAVVPATNYGKQLFLANGINYPSLSTEEYKECKTWEDIGIK